MNQIGICKSVEPFKRFVVIDDDWFLGKVSTGRNEGVKMGRHAWICRRVIE